MPDDYAVGRQIQAVRLAKNLSQSDVAARAGISASTLSRLEHGELSSTSVSTLRAVARALKMPSIVLLGWRGPEVDRLLDETHAALVEAMARILIARGWVLAPERSFSEWGERGSVDILAWHPSTRALLVVEVKSRLWNIQDCLSTLDRKRRLMPNLAARMLGWRSLRVGTVLVMPDTRGHRARIERHSATFGAALPARQIQVRHWLDNPAGSLDGLYFLNISHGVEVRQRSGRRRGRVRLAKASNRRVERHEGGFERSDGPKTGGSGAPCRLCDPDP